MLLKSTIQSIIILATFITFFSLNVWVCPRVVVMDYGIVVIKFVFQLHYYVHFRENIPGKGMNPLSSQR